MGSFLRLIVVVLSAWPAFSLAEYRVFLIQKNAPDGSIVQEFPSSLDPQQYLSFFPLPKGYYYTYSKTWMCKGPTDQFKPYCPAPETSSINPPTIPTANPPQESLQDSSDQNQRTPANSP